MFAINLLKVTTLLMMFLMLFTCAPEPAHAVECNDIKRIGICES